MTDQQKKKDTSPFIRSRRIQRNIRIEERNIPASPTFDITVEYPTNELPEWFQGLQSILEDETFKAMQINLNNRVFYNLNIARAGQTVNDAEEIQETIEQTLDRFATRFAELQVRFATLQVDDLAPYNRSLLIQFLENLAAIARVFPVDPHVLAHNDVDWTQEPTEEDEPHDSSLHD